MRIVLVTIVAAALGATAARAAGNAWPPLRTAGPFLVQEVHEKTAGEWGKAWLTLYPAHQRIAPRQLYVACESSSSFPAPLRSVRVVGARRALVHVAGLASPVPGVAVTLLVELGTSGRDAVVFQHTFHLIPVRGHWRWILSPGRYKLYVNRGCDPGLAV
jgi:hypothetical protein